MESEQWLRIRAWTEPAEMPPRGGGEIIVEAEIPTGCYIESHEPSAEVLLPTILVLDSQEGLFIGPVKYPKPIERSLEWNEGALSLYEGKIKFSVPIEVHAEAVEGKKKIKGRITYQGCTSTICLMPGSQEFTVEFEVV